MRLLVANIPLPYNRFLVDLNDALSRHCDLTHSSDAFWNMEGEYDVVHLHFPEYLTFDLQDAYIRGLTAEHITAVRERLEFWASRCVIVVTRHVLLPHDARDDPMWSQMYEMIYSYADGVVHFANASVAEFKERYRNTDFVRGVAPEHGIIPHQNYESLPNNVSRSEARRALGIRSNANVLLVFGAIRSDEERDLVSQTFDSIDVPNKVLLVSHWPESLAKVGWIRLKYWLRDLKRVYYRFHPRFKFNYGFVSEEDTQLYFNAADVLFIARFHVLNSGNVTLGMTFGKVVVGPDSWDVGELLRETGNPVFEPDRPATAALAVQDGFRLAREGYVGARNGDLAHSQWSVHQCAARYVRFYTSIIQRASSVKA
jgi:hypothetical protein